MKGIRFEGGLSPRRSARGDRNFRATGYEPHLSRRFTPLEYLEKTRASAVVLNNPAYEGCHSWRLAESLALGKAIISTPIVRELPAPLVHGTHLHCVDGSVESFRSAIGMICGDADYRARLETRARAYYEEYLAPTAVVRRILHAVTDAGAKETSASLAC
jgi:glycosyltransferase involved in cell wall biosynthesis